MCGCSANFDGQDDFDFTGNRPSLVEVGEDSSFDFMTDIESNSQFDDFLGKKARAKRQERKLKKQGQDTTTQTTRSTEETDDEKSTYGGGWFGRNWHWLLIGAVVVGGGIYVYKKRKG
jgi:hypothetical protein